MGESSKGLDLISFLVVWAQRRTSRTSLEGSGKGLRVWLQRFLCQLTRHPWSRVCWAFRSNVTSQHHPPKQGNAMTQMCSAVPFTKSLKFLPWCFVWGRDPLKLELDFRKQSSSLENPFRVPTLWKLLESLRFCFPERQQKSTKLLRIFSPKHTVKLLSLSLSLSLSLLPIQDSPVRRKEREEKGFTQLKHRPRALSNSSTRWKLGTQSLAQSIHFSSLLAHLSKSGPQKSQKNYSDVFNSPTF